MNNFKAFSELRLPVELGLGAVGGPEFNTILSINANGFEQRNINWLFARAKYDIAPGIKTTAQLENLMLFFRAHKGKAIGFRFKDWNDAIAQKEFQLISDGVASSFQLIKTYQLGDLNDVRLIHKPVNGSLEVFSNNKKIPSQCDYTTGRVTFLRVPAKDCNITASFAFDVPVRFDIDFLPFSSEANPQISSIPLIEVRI